MFGYLTKVKKMRRRKRKKTERKRKIRMKRKKKQKRNPQKWSVGKKIFFFLCCYFLPGN